VAITGCAGGPGDCGNLTNVQRSAVRYDPQAGNLYFLEGGTIGAQYKNGTLKVIAHIH
jgi:hypothetical protein